MHELTSNYAQAMSDPQPETVEATVFFDVLSSAENQNAQDADQVVGALQNVLQAYVPPVNPGVRIPPGYVVQVAFENLPEKFVEVDGCVAIHINIVAIDVWRYVSALQDVVYNPDSMLKKGYVLKLNPCRVYVKEARLTSTVAEITKESAHVKLAAIAAKQAFFKLAKQEITTREALAESLLQAEAAKLKLDQMSTMFDEIAATCSDPDQVKKGFALLKASHTAVQENASIVSRASAESLTLHARTEKAKLAAYFCSARTGVSESYQDWSKREFVFTYLPKNMLPDSSKSKVHFQILF
jgi:hypothetical protein